MEPNWDDLRIFLSLAREGTLTTAARALGVSHPTVARRVQALEKQIGARLFERLPDRFVPTSAGEELLADTEAMEKAALSINRRSAGLGDTVSGVVRLSAGEAMAALLARHLPELRSSLDQIEFELSASHTLANLSRREADLLIREQMPDLGGIVASEVAIGPIAFRHEPTGAVGEIAGHLHPKARVATRGRSMERRCFACDGERAVMPAFGAYTGGLSIRDPAFAKIFRTPGFMAHVLGDNRLHAIAASRCY